MVEILEVKDAEKRRAILRQGGIAEDEATVLKMADHDAVLGSCCLHIRKDKAVLLALAAGEYDFGGKPDAEQSFILDSLVRSAASYAETKGALFIETAFPDFYDFFRRMGFETDSNHAFGSIAVIVKYHA